MRRPKQQALDLGRHTVARNRGGRPRGKNPRVPHASRKFFSAAHPCHVTIRVIPGLPSLRDEEVVREIEDSFRRGCERKGFRLIHYSIQDDHVHVIVEAKDRDTLGRGMMSIASRLARAVNRAFGRSGKVLVDRYHLRVLTCPRQARNTMLYVLSNDRRHEAKRIARLRASGMRIAPLPGNEGRLDAFSSARWFDGWRSDVAIDRRTPPGLGASPAVAEPLTWLLRDGWRRGGRWLDPNVIPGALA